MNIKNIKGSIALKAICLILALALAISVFAIFSSNIQVSAKSNSDLWGNNSNLIVDNNKITTKSDDNVQLRYKPSIDMTNFNLKFKITSSDFDKFVIALSTNATMESKYVGTIYTNINLEKKADGKIKATINDEESVDVAQNFVETDLNLTFDNTEKIFKLNDTKIGAEKRYFDYDVANQMNIKMQNIKEDKTASVEIKEICGQDVTKSFSDANKPVIKAKDGKVSSVVPVGTTVKLPFIALDSLDNDLDIKLEVKYAAEEAKLATTTDKATIIKSANKIEDAFVADRAGFYKATLTVKDSSGNTETKEFKTINAVTATMNNITINSEYSVDSYAEAGDYFKVAKPVVKYEIAESIFTEQVKVAVQYKAPNSATWLPSKQDIINENDENTLLAILGSKVGTYKYRYVALDKDNNIEVDKKEYTITFTDQTAPVIKVEGFVEEAIINKSYSITMMNATDKGSSNLTNTTKVFFKGETDEEIKIEGNSFVPNKLGDYYVEYKAVDESGNETKVIKTFKVVEDTTQAVGASLSALEIVFICIAAAALIGLVLLFVIKPKK